MEMEETGEKICVCIYYVKAELKKSIFKTLISFWFLTVAWRWLTLLGENDIELFKSNM